MMDIVDKIKEFTLNGDGYNSEYNLMLLEAIETIESLRQQLAEQTSASIPKSSDNSASSSEIPNNSINSFQNGNSSVEVLLEALRPFAAFAQHYPKERTYGNRPNFGVVYGMLSGAKESEITVEDFHRANDALNAYSSKPKKHLDNSDS